MVDNDWQQRIRQTIHSYKPLGHHCHEWITWFTHDERSVIPLGGDEFAQKYIRRSFLLNCIGWNRSLVVMRDETSRIKLSLQERLGLDYPSYEK